MRARGAGYQAKDNFDLREEDSKCARERNYQHILTCCAQEGRVGGDPRHLAQQQVETTTPLYEEGEVSQLKLSTAAKG